MAAAFLRRSVATAGLAVLATVASPLVGTALASGFSGTISSDPADSSGTIAANRPTFIATYTSNLAAGSTITVKQGSTTVACPQTVAAKTVSCTPNADLVDGDSYDVTSHGVSAADGSTADAPAKSYTIDIPSVTGSIPLQGGSLVAADSNNPLSMTFDEGIFDAASTFVVHDANNDVPSGSVSYSSSSIDPTSPDDTISFTPSPALPNGAYTATVHVDGLSGSADNPRAFFDKTFNFWVNNAAPGNVSHPTYINNVNNSAVPFSGTAAPGLTVNVDIINNQDPGHVQDGSDGTGSVLVPSCDAAPVCPWSVNVDASRLGDQNPSDSPDGTYSWTASTSDGNTGATNSSNSGGAPANGTIIEDTTAPDAPSVTASMDPLSATTLRTAATDASTDVASYSVDVTDSAATPTTLHFDFSAVSHNLPQQSMDVSSLADGTLNVLVTAIDGAGNATFPTNALTGAPSPTKVTKNVGLKEDFADSFLTVDGNVVSFPSAAAGAVRKPSSITVEFTQPIRLDWVDNSGTHGFTPVHHHSSVCVQRANSPISCVNGSPTATQDGKGFTVPINGIGSDGGFTISYTNIWPAAFCPDLKAGPPATQNSACIGKTGTVQDPTTNSNFVFNVDDTPPPATSISMPAKIGPDAVHFVGISGTTEPNATVNLTIKSSGGGPTFLAGHGSPITADGTGNWQTVEDLSTVRDGKLTVTAKVFDAAGNETDSTASPAPVLAAHVSRLTESVSGSIVTYGRGVLVSGRLVDQSGAAIRGATVTIRPRFDDGKFGAGQTATTTSTGHWSRTEFPAHNATWYASYAGKTTSPLHDAAAVHSARTLVKVSIAFLSPRNRAKVGSPVVLTGRVGPNKAGKTVSIYRHTSRGNTLVGRAKLDRHSHWSFKLKLPRGTTKLFAVIGRTFGNLGNRTGYLTITH